MKVSNCQIILGLLILTITVTGTIFIIANGFESQSDCNKGYKYDKRSSNCWKCPDGYRKKLWQQWDSSKACEQKGMFKFKTKAAVYQKKKSTVITPEPDLGINEISYIDPSSFNLINIYKFRTNRIKGELFDDATLYNKNYEYIISFRPGKSTSDQFKIDFGSICKDPNVRCYDPYSNFNDFYFLSVVLKKNNLQIMGGPFQVVYQKSLEQKIHVLKAKRSPTEWNIYLDGNLVKTIDVSNLNEDQLDLFSLFTIGTSGNKKIMKIGIKFNEL